MWTAAQMSSHANCSYNQCFALTLLGPLRVDSLRVALDRAAMRHGALRAVFDADGATQTLRPSLAGELPVIDLSGSAPNERERAIRELLDRECMTPFDLAEGPLLRGFVVRKAPDEHVFVLTVHHIVCDGWSSAVLFTDLGRLYAADCTGIPAEL